MAHFINPFTEKIIDIASLSKEEREMYDENIKVYRDNLATMPYAEEKGRNEGRIEGRAEIAQNLKAMGLDAVAINKATGLTPDEIQKL